MHTPAPGEKPNSSPNVACEGKRSAMIAFMACSACLSASVTGERSSLRSTLIFWRKRGVVTAAAASATCCAACSMSCVTTVSVAAAIALHLPLARCGPRARRGAARRHRAGPEASSEGAILPAARDERRTRTGADGTGATSRTANVHRQLASQAASAGGAGRDRRFHAFRRSGIYRIVAMGPVSLEGGRYAHPAMTTRVLRHLLSFHWVRKSGGPRTLVPTPTPW